MPQSQEGSGMEGWAPVDLKITRASRSRRTKERGSPLLTGLAGGVTGIPFGLLIGHAQGFCGETVAAGSPGRFGFGFGFGQTSDLGGQLFFFRDASRLDGLHALFFLQPLAFSLAGHPSFVETAPLGRLGDDTGVINSRARIETGNGSGFGRRGIVDTVGKGRMLESWQEDIR